MTARSDQDQDIALSCAPNQWPVWFDVTFPTAEPLTGQTVRSLAWIEGLGRQETLDYSPELVEIFPASPGAP